MKRQEAYPSKFFKAADYDQDWEMTVEIELARMEEIGADGKKNETEAETPIGPGVVGNRQWR